MFLELSSQLQIEEPSPPHPTPALLLFETEAASTQAPSSTLHALCAPSRRLKPPLFPVSSGKEAKSGHTVSASEVMRG